MSGGNGIQSDEYDVLPEPAAAPKPPRPTPIVSEKARQCPDCGYDLRSQSSDVCPECGQTWKQALEVKNRRGEMLEWFVPFRFAVYSIGFAIIWGVAAWPLFHSNSLAAAMVAAWIGRLMPILAGIYGGYMASEESSSEDGALTAFFVAVAAAGLTFVAQIAIQNLIV